MVSLRRLAFVGLAAAVVCANASAAPVKVRPALDHGTVEFGDPVTATVTVFLDPSAPAPDVRLQEALAPLTQLGATKVTDVTRGDVRTVTYSARASCLDERCVSTRGSKRITLRPVAVTVGQEKSTAEWPPLEVRGRVSAADVARLSPPLRSDTSPPPVTYRVAAGNAARALDVLAIVLAAAGLLLGAWTIAAVRRNRKRGAPLTGLERALALAREAERRPPPDRRRALGLLARLLDARDPRLAGAADELAWSAPAPTRDELAGLVSEVEHEVDGT